MSALSLKIKLHFQTAAWHVIESKYIVTAIIQANGSLGIFQVCFLQQE